MKLKRITSLFLAAAISVAIAVPSVLGTTVSADENKSGVEIEKKATYNRVTDDYTITLEAYATGSKVITQQKQNKPTDIVLVLDQSGSMGYCINCGANFHYGKWPDNNPFCGYEEAGPADTIQKSDSVTYYYKGTAPWGDSYYEAVYCDGTERNHNGHNGWYKQDFLGHGDALGTTTLYKGIEHEHRLDALKKALNNFYKSVEEKANATENHRIAVVGYSSSGYSNTELLTGVTLNSGQQVTGGQYYYYPTTSGINGAQYDNNGITVNQYKAALQDMSTDEGKQSVENAFNALTASGGTKTDDGLTMAENIFKNNTVQNGADGKPARNRVVILFTDGDTNSDRATTIQTAYSLKNTYNATVYCVGILDDANGTPVTGNNWGGTSDANKFLHLISSNFKNANSWYPIPSTNTYPESGSYYLSASNSSALSNIFEEIAGNINTESSVTELDENTVIKDVVSQQFTMPEGTTDIKVYTQESNGSTTNWKDRVEFKAQIEVNQEDRSISVSNFSFKDNWIGEENNLGESGFHDGKKLIIEFTVKAKDGFLGGNDVYTNTSAGVYKDSNATTPEFTFNRPQVNVPIKDVTVTAEDKNVYLLGELTADEIKSGATAKCGNVELKLSEENYGLESWQTDYVNINVTYTDANGDTLSDLDALQADTTYTVSVTISPKTDGSSTDQGETATAKSGSDTGNINVFKPTLTFKDSQVWYGDTPPESYDNLTSTVWKHGADTADTEKMGTAPTLNLTYTPDSTKISDGKINSKQDIPVDVTVSIGTTDVTSNTTFVHTPCETGENAPTGGKFWLHVNTCQLTITKKAGTNTTIDNDEYFVFTVKKDGSDYTRVTIQGTGSVTIRELPVGTYTVTEDENVAWRYTPSYDKTTVSLTTENSSDTVTYTNTLKNDKWLNDFTRVINTYGEDGGKEG